MLAITMGDPNGIGPEIICRYLQKYPNKNILIVGNQRVLTSCWRSFANPVLDPFGKIKEWGEGRAVPENGAASYAYVTKAIELAKNKEIEGLVTAPINKTALHLAGFNIDGHTEILAQRTGTRKFAMMFWSPTLKIMLTTIHKALRSVPELITAERFVDTIELAKSGLADLGIKEPRIAVCGLNPHAGENGIFGDEEERVLNPIITDYQKKGLAIAGPFPADTMFIPERSKKYDLVIAHYHDQGLIPLKMQAFDSAVNITVGLPIVRTSVDHGTAYDIVGQGKAHIDSLKNAVMIAKKIIRNRKNART